MPGLLDYWKPSPGAKTDTERLLGLLYPNGYQGGLLGQEPMTAQISNAAQKQQELVASGAPVRDVALAGNPVAQQFAGFMGNIKPIRAFHGSPHNFDRFDASKIGTGEGAQAYGHGLYFAENEGVARSYRDALEGATLTSPSGELLMTRTRDGNYHSPYLNGDAQTQIMGRAMQHVMASNGDFAAAKAAAGDPKIAAAIGWMEKQGSNFKPDGAGHMYEVNIHADPQRMLNLDAPVQKQVDLARPVFETILRQLDYPPPHDPKGATSNVQNLMKWAGDLDFVRDKYGVGQTGVTGMFKDAGILGGRYRDAHSRATNPDDWRIMSVGDSVSAKNIRTGQNSPSFKSSAEAREWIKSDTGKTNNYVIFDPSIVEIIRKYGLLGPAVAGGGLLAPKDE